MASIERDFRLIQTKLNHTIPSLIESRYFHKEKDSRSIVLVGGLNPTPDESELQFGLNPNDVFIIGNYKYELIYLSEEYNAIILKINDMFLSLNVSFKKSKREKSNHLISAFYSKNLNKLLSFIWSPYQYDAIMWNLYAYACFNNLELESASICGGNDDTCLEEIEKESQLFFTDTDEYDSEHI